MKDHKNRTIIVICINVVLVVAMIAALIIYSVTQTALNHEANYGFAIIMGIAILIMGGVNCLFLAETNKKLNRIIKETEEARSVAESANVAKSRFLSTMSHEIRTPLNAIIGLASLSLMSTDDEKRTKDYLKKIDYSSKLLLSLINDILDMSAIESQKMKLVNSEFNLKQLLTSLASVYFEQCRNKGVDFDTIVSNAYSERLVGDELRLNQILLNLMSNATKFTPRGGSVKLRIKQLSSDGKQAIMRFEVIDTGCGMSDEMQARLFNPFEQASGATAKRFGGSGLGLSIAKNLTELMGGIISVKSKINAGSTFTVEIPFGIAESSEMVPGTMKTIRALVVDDEQDTLDYITSILDKIGVKSETAMDGLQALEVLSKKGTDNVRFDACIIDWRMPNMDGIETTKAIRRQLGKSPLIIMISAYDTNEIIDECYKSGADMVLPKPLFPSTIYNAFVKMTSGQIAVKEQSTMDYDFTGKRLLLVEDNKLNSEIAKAQLTMVNFKVDTALNGKEAVRIFTSSKPNTYDAILMDVQMPEMNGYEATAAIRKSSHSQARSIPILAMTADAFENDVKLATESGMDAHSAKPIDIQHLFETLQQLIYL